MIIRSLKTFSFFWLFLFPSIIFSFELDQSAIDSFAEEMGKNFDFDVLEVREMLSVSVGSEKIVQLMSRPAEKTKSWEEYRNIFVTSGRIRQGCNFWKVNEDSLNRAFKVYGVSPSIITSIVGIETIYGSNVGSHRLLDSLPTLAFHYPGGSIKRMKFFRFQLQEFFLLSREEGLEMESLKGSYAGAIGIPQFMPNNYRKLAVDFDGDGEKNIIESSADSIGSVANYLKHHGWRAAQPVYTDATIKRGRKLAFATNVGATNELLRSLDALDFDSAGFPLDTPVSVIRFKEGSAYKYWVAFENFYALFRYNPRVKYALVVALLASAVEEKCDFNDNINQ